MRLLAPHNYRAYPELDRFSDEQCGYFVRVANRSWRARAWRWPLLGVMVAGAVMVSVRVTWPVVRFGETHRIPGGVFGVFVVTGAVAIGSLVAGMVLAMVVRDWLLGRRVRRVLLQGGTCATCGYVLLGIRVGEDLRVSCPECGEVAEVDPSLNELAEGPGGVREYRPQVPREQRVARERRLCRRRLVIRLAAGAAIVSVFLLSCGYGLLWWTLVRDARAASAARDGHQRLAELSRLLQPEEFQSDAETDAFTEAVTEVTTVMREVNDAWREDPDRPFVKIDFSIFSHKGTPEAYDKSARLEGAYAGTLELTSMAYKELCERGTLDRLRRLTTCRALALKIDLPQSEPLISLRLPTLGMSRTVARLSSGRMELALAAGDQAEYLEALAEGMCAARSADGQVFLISRLVGSAIDGLLLVQIEEHAGKYPNAEWVAGVRELVEQRFARPSSALNIQGERIAAVDTARWFYSDPSRVRKAMFTGGVLQTLGGTGPRSPVLIDRYPAVERDMDGYYGAWEAYMSVPPEKRGPPPLNVGSTLIMKVLAPALARFPGSEIQSERQRRTVTVRLAMEQRRLETGRYPTTLDEISGMVPAAALTDALTGQRLVLHFVPDLSAHGGERPVLMTPAPEDESPPGPPVEK